MVTTDLGWSSAGCRAARFLARSAGVSALVLVLAGNVAHAQAKRGHARMVELNKQALASYDAKDFEAARDSLTKALKEAKQAGLEDDKMTARTYLHLGAVYWTGFRDRSMALQNFTLAKRIRPDIQLTPSLDTAELRAIFDLAGGEPEAAPSLEPPGRGGRTPPRVTTPLTPPPDPGLDSESRAGRGRPRVGRPLRAPEDTEPDLPTTMTAPLMCAVPEEAPPGVELALRCALKPGINAKGVRLRYRLLGEEAYRALDMRRTAKGWYLALVPAHIVKGKSLQLYFEARGSGETPVATHGQPDSPTIVEIRKKGEEIAALGGHEEDPMWRLRQQAKLDRYEAGLHRRRQGAFWFGVGGGSGWGYAPAGKLEWQNTIQVSQVMTVAGLFTVLPEIGYMWSDRFALTLQARVEYIRQDQGMIRKACTSDPCDEKWQPYSPKTGAPTIWAPAVFLRGIWYADISTGGNLQFMWSANVGGGFVRFPIQPSRVSNVAMVEDPKTGELVPNVDPKKYIAKTDTRPLGIVLLGPSAGFIWHLSRHFALALDGRALTGLPNWGLVVEAGFSVQIALGGKGGPAAEKRDEEDGEEEREDGEGPEAGGGPEKDAPSREEPSAPDVPDVDEEEEE